MMQLILGNMPISRTEKPLRLGNPQKKSKMAEI